MPSNYFSLCSNKRIFLKECFWNKHQRRNSSHLIWGKKAQQSLQNLTTKLTGLARAGMRWRVLWSVKMFWALETVWTAARLVTTVSPDKSRLREPARTWGGASGRAASLPAAAPWLPGRGRAAGCSHIHHPCTCRAPPLTSGTSLLFPSSSMSLLLSNQKLKSTEGVKNNSRARAEQQL